MGSALSKQPWRTIPDNKQEDLDFVTSYRPCNKEVQHLRVLLHGPVGAGKSSFVNSVESVFKGRCAFSAQTDATSGSSYTKKYLAHKIHKDPEHFPTLIFNDIMGFEENTNGVNVEDVKLALRGHVTEGYQFKPEKPLKEGEQGYNSSPTLGDRVHVLVCVIPAGSVNLLSVNIVKNVREVRLAASDMGIPQLAILTKVDEACDKVKKDVRNVYKSKYLQKQVDKISTLLGFSPNCVFPVKNYHSEIATNDDINVLILTALRQMISFGEDFLNNLQG